MTATKILTQLQVDDPIKQGADFRYDKPDRAYLDDQIRGTQQHVVDSVLSGTQCSWYVLSGSSAALVPGDVFCLAASTAGHQSVTKATPGALASAGGPAGIAMTAVSPGVKFRGAIGGTLPSSITGLTAGAAQPVRVSTAARAERVTQIAPADFAIGFSDTQGNITHAKFVASGGGGDASWAQPVDNVAALRAVTASNRSNKQNRALRLLGKLFLLRNDIATPSDDGATTIVPSDGSGTEAWVNVSESPTIATIAALRNAKLGVHQRVRVLAYATLGDGGGGEFLWNSTNNNTTRPDNGGTIIVPTGLTTGCWERQYDKHHLSVKWFGAKGDGATNDAPAIQAAIDVAGAARTNGEASVVLFPSGGYLCSAKLFVHSAVILKGVGHPAGGLDSLANNLSTLFCNVSCTGGYFILFDGAAGNGPAAGGGMVGLRIVQHFGTSGGAENGTAIGIVGVDSDHRPLWQRLHLLVIEQDSAARPWTSAVRWDGSACGGLLDCYMTEVTAHVSGTGPSVKMTSVAGMQMIGCALYFTMADVEVTGAGGNLSGGIIMKGCNVAKLTVDYCSALEHDGVVGQIAVGANNTGPINVRPGNKAVGAVADDQYLGASWFDPTQIGQFIGGYRFSRAVALNNQKYLFGLSSDQATSYAMIGNIGVQLRLDPFGVMLFCVGGVSSITNHTAGDILLPKLKSIRMNNNADSTTLRHLTSDASDNTIVGADATGVILKTGAAIKNHFTGSKTWDPASVASLGNTTTTVTVTGAVPGDPVTVGFSQDLLGCMLTGYVSSADTVVVVLFNPTVGAVDLASGTLRASTTHY